MKKHKRNAEWNNGRNSKRPILKSNACKNFTQEREQNTGNEVFTKPSRGHVITYLLISLARLNKRNTETSAGYFFNTDLTPHQNTVSISKKIFMSSKDYDKYQKSFQKRTWRLRKKCCYTSKIITIEQQGWNLNRKMRISPQHKTRNKAMIQLVE